MTVCIFAFEIDEIKMYFKTTAKGILFMTSHAGNKSFGQSGTGLPLLQAEGVKETSMQ